MRRMPWTMCLWPGLPQLWSYGSWSGLALAIGAAAVLDLLLLVSFGWSELIGQSLRNTLWAAFGVVWVDRGSLVGKAVSPPGSGTQSLTRRKTPSPRHWIIT